MSKDEKRSEIRHRALIPAFASDLDETRQLRCLIRDVSESGCQLVASRFYEIPEVFHLTPDGFSKPILGRVVWQDRKLVGVRLETGGDTAAPANALSSGDALISCKDGVLLLGEDRHRALSYEERLEIYFAELEAAPEKP